MGNKPSTTTTTNTATKNPWDPTIAPLTGIVNQAQTLAGDVGNFTPTTSSQTQSGIDMLTRLSQGGPTAGNQALNNVVGGSGQGFNTGLGQLSSVANGGMLNSNTYLDPVINRTMNDTADKVNSQFTAGGRYGSGAHTGTLTKELGNTAANMRLGNYTTERAAQDAAAKTLYGGGLQGAGFSGQLDQTAAMPAQYALQAGQIQDRINEAQRQAPMNALNWQASITNPIAQMGGTNNSTNTQQTVQPTNWLTTGLGIGMAGLGAMSGNPMALANLGKNMGGLMGGLGGKETSPVNGYANNDPYGSYDLR